MLLKDAIVPEEKPEPVMVKVKAGPPAFTVFGEMLVMVGTAAPMVNVTELDDGPDGLAKVICAVPG